MIIMIIWKINNRTKYLFTISLKTIKKGGV